MTNVVLGLSALSVCPFRIIKGDITKVKVDAIVNPANSWMIMGGGVAGAIRRAGGQVIESEARKYAPVPVGEAVVTGAGRLPCKYVIHAPTMERPAMRTTIDKVRAAVRAALRAADNVRAKSVAFPGMGTGVGGLDPREAASAMVETMIKELPRLSNVSEVLLVAFNEELYRAFMDAVLKFAEECRSLLRESK